MVVKSNLLFPHLSIWLDAGSSELHWQVDFLSPLHTAPSKPHSLTSSHLSPIFLLPLGTVAVKIDNSYVAECQ